MDVIRIPSQLGVVLRAARLQRDFTQADVAKKLGVTVQAVSKLENNANRASFERIHRLCLILGLEIMLRPKDSAPSQNDGDTRVDW